MTHTHLPVIYSLVVPWLVSPILLVLVHLLLASFGIPNSTVLRHGERNLPLPPLLKTTRLYPSSMYKVPLAPLYENPQATIRMSMLNAPDSQTSSLFIQRTIETPGRSPFFDKSHKYDSPVKQHASSCDSQTKTPAPNTTIATCIYYLQQIDFSVVPNWQLNVTDIHVPRLIAQDKKLMYIYIYSYRDNHWLMIVTSFSLQFHGAKNIFSSPL